MDGIGNGDTPKPSEQDVTNQNQEGKNFLNQNLTRREFIIGATVGASAVAVNAAVESKKSPLDFLKNLAKKVIQTNNAPITVPAKESYDQYQTRLDREKLERENQLKAANQKVEFDALNKSMTEEQQKKAQEIADANQKRTSFPSKIVPDNNTDPAPVK